MRILATSIFLIYICYNATAQRLDKLSDLKPFEYSGNINTSQIYHNYTFIDSSINPYTYIVSGNLNMRIYEAVDLPLQFTYVKNDKLNKQPFDLNQLGITPSYKWVKAYCGFTSMNLSPYSLSGHQFLGGGVELTPPIGIRFAAMYGRLRKAVTPDSLTYTQPSFKRMGMGFKVGYEGNLVGVLLTLFHAKDVADSALALYNNTYLSPVENLVVDITPTLKINQSLVFTLNIARSLYTLNNAEQATNIAVTGVNKVYSQFVAFKPSTVTGNAVKAHVAYNKPDYKIGLGYELVEPTFFTLGTYYFINDFKNYTIDATKNISNGKLTVFTKLGVQYNNISKLSSNKSTQMVGMLNINIVPSTRYTISLGYSNFSTYTTLHNLTQLYKPTTSLYLTQTDTMSFVRLSHTFNAMFNILLNKPENKKYKHNLILSGFIQKTSDEQNNNKLLTGASVYNSNVNYRFTILPYNFAIINGVNLIYSSISNNKTTIVAPQIGFSKVLLNRKLTINQSNMYNIVLGNNIYSNNYISIRFGCNYTLFKHHNINFNLVWFNKSPIKNIRNRYVNDFTGMLSYNYNF